MMEAIGRGAGGMAEPPQTRRAVSQVVSVIVRRLVPGRVWDRKSSPDPFQRDPSDPDRSNLWGKNNRLPVRVRPGRTSAALRSWPELAELVARILSTRKQYNSAAAQPAGLMRGLSSFLNRQQCPVAPCASRPFHSIAPQSVRVAPVASQTSTLTRNPPTLDARFKDKPNFVFTGQATPQGRDLRVSGSPRRLNGLNDPFSFPWLSSSLSRALGEPVLLYSPSAWYCSQAKPPLYCPFVLAVLLPLRHPHS
eukprot:gene15204-21279_t